MNSNLQHLKTRELQIFLVQRFLLVMVFIYISHQFVSMIYRTVFLHLMVDVMEAGHIVGIGDSMMIVFEILIIVAINILSDIIPIVGRDMMAGFMQNFFNISVRAPSFVRDLGPSMVRIYYITLAVLIILQLTLTFAPYVLGGWWYIHGVSQKMDEIREMETQQKREYDRRRNLLFSDIVHDVKTPITTISGYTRALLDGLVEDPVKEHEYLQAINSKSMRISELITMLFEFVKLDSDGFTLHPQKLDLAELVRENVIMLFADFEEKGLEVDFDIPEEVCMCNVDKIQMSRVVTNLLTNTIRYLKAGDRVMVSMVEMPHELEIDHVFYKVSVADDGIPIEESLVDNIFDPFTRADSARSTVSGGSGLGLSIAHKIADMHGGNLVLNQPCGGGYTKAFEIYVPKV
ncbi:MAG TPA: hypothetical protein DCM49_06285 [Lachnospiraceae bacterium]|nr:hypothetical protein [Lachnospiraceae bacterium]